MKNASADPDLSSFFTICLMFQLLVAAFGRNPNFKFNGKASGPALYPLQVKRLLDPPWGKVTSMGLPRTVPAHILNQGRLAWGLGCVLTATSQLHPLPELACLSTQFCPSPAKNRLCTSQTHLLSTAFDRCPWADADASVDPIAPVLT